MKNKKIQEIISELSDQYITDTNKRPWIIGFSGGKDSTVLLTLVWKALIKIKGEMSEPYELQRPVYVVCNDTMVENPIIAEYVDDVLTQIDEAAREQNLPVFVKKTTPKIDNTFWVNIIGKGYPVPNNSFRWCTDKLKINPTSNFITEQVNENGEAIILIGARSSESSTRAKSIKKHEIKGKRLTKHPNHYNTMVYAPIKSLMLEEIWYIINTWKSPWGYDNSKLYRIYSDASADDYECPTVVTDKKHTSCGQSRFGCWTCTVVKKDKSMTALIDNGQKWMMPLLKLRDKLLEDRNVSNNRMDTRRNGKKAITEDGHKQGNYTPKYRAELLKKLLKIQHEIQKIKPHIELITNQELIAIQVYWYRDGVFNFKVGDIYSSIYEQEFQTENSNIESFTEKRLLKTVCANNTDDYNLIKNLLSLQHSKTLLLNKYGLHNDIENRIEQFVKEGNYEN